MRGFHGLAAALTAAASIVLAGSPAFAQEYPSKPITWISPWNAGGSSDTISRAVAQEAAKILGQPVVVENRPGASGTLGSAFVANAEPDGYTVVIGSTPTHATAPLMYKDLPYNPENDFAPVTLLGVLPNVLVVHPSLPVKSVDELVAYAKEHPGELNYYSPGPGTSQHLSAELFKTMTGVDIVHVPYTGSAPAMVDLLAGRINIAFENMSTVLPHIESGAIVPLGVTSPGRSDILPDIPSIDEAGIKGYDASLWLGVFAPAGTPPERLVKLGEALAAALETPALATRLKELGVRVDTNTPDEFKAFQAQEIVKWTEVIKAAGVEPR